MSIRPTHTYVGIGTGLFPGGKTALNEKSSLVLRNAIQSVQNAVVCKLDMFNCPWIPLAEFQGLLENQVYAVDRLGISSGFQGCDDENNENQK
nr:hypothetical protein Iba_chr09cCG8930 [Ipomoea batatas]